MGQVRLTKTMLDSLNPSDIARDLRRDNPSAGITLHFALSTVVSYLSEAGVQQRRIVRDQRAINEHFKQLRDEHRLDQDGSSRRTRRHRPHAFRSVHFYLTCWRMIGRHLELVSETSGLRSVKIALRPHRRTLEKYKDMRDNYEHFDQRLPGRGNRRRRRARSRPVATNLGNFLGFTLTFGGERVDIGPDSLVLLKRIVSEVLTAFKLEALEQMAGANPRIVQRWFIPLRIKYLQRQARRLFKERDAN